MWFSNLRGGDKKEVVEYQGIHAGTSLLGDYDLSGLRAIQWGSNHERVAIVAYEKYTGSSVTASGIWLSSSGCLVASLAKKRPLK